MGWDQYGRNQLNEEERGRTISEKRCHAGENALGVAAATAAHEADMKNRTMKP